MLEINEAKIDKILQEILELQQKDYRRYAISKFKLDDDRDNLENEYTILPFITDEDLANMCGQVNVNIFNHHARHKLFIGAKDSGKTFPIVLKGIQMMQQDNMANWLATRKYKTQAVDMLTKSIFEVINYLEWENYGLKHVWESVANQGIRIVKNKKQGQKLKNQIITMNSFEDPNSLAGASLANGGYFALWWIEEPIQMGDTTEGAIDFEKSLKNIKDSILRKEKPYNALMQKKDPNFKPVKTQIMFSMNDWDKDHYLSKLSEKIFPRMEFMFYALGLNPIYVMGKRNEATLKQNWEKIKMSLLLNHTATRYDKESDFLIIRKTKFANPKNHEPEDANNIFKDVYKALVDENWNTLAIYLGMADDDNKAKYTYKFRSKDIGKTLNFKANEDDFYFKDKYIDSITMGWDIDFNRRMVLTTIVETTNKIDGEKHLSVMPQMVVETYSASDASSIRSISKEMYQYMLRVLNYFNTIAPYRFTKMVYIDDNQQTFLRDFYHMIENGEIDSLKPAIKNGYYGILNRINLLQNILDKQILTISNDDANKELITTITTIPKNERGMRIEKGKFERMMDTLNSLEIALFPYYHLCLQLIGEKNDRQNKSL